MKEIFIDELKSLQLDVLSAVDKYCSEHGLHYSMIDGTLLGAIRHKGYIPWDDDIDIALLRDDYEKFISGFPNNYLGCYCATTMKKNKDWLKPYAKVYDDRTVIIEGMDAGKCGVNIDVFPIDDVPDNQSDWELYKKKLRLFFGIQAIKLIRWRKERPLAKNLLMLLLKCLALPISKRRIGKICDKISKENNNLGYSRCYENCFGIWGKNPFNKSVFNNIQKIKFEDRYFCAVNDYEEVLRSTYGDYMKLPPAEDRVTHHVFKAWWKE